VGRAELIEMTHDCEHEMVYADGKIVLRHLGLRYFLKKGRSKCRWLHADRDYQSLRPLRLGVDGCIPFTRIWWVLVLEWR
jgi:hypothetical protein